MRPERNGTSEIDIGRNPVDTLLDSSASQEARTKAAAVINGPVQRASVVRIVDLVRSPDERTAWDAATALARIRSKMSTRPLIHVLTEARFEHSKRSAIHALHRLRDRRALGALIRVANDNRNSEMVRAAAYDALSPFADVRRVFRALCSGLGDPCAMIRHRCLVALSPRVGQPDVLQAVSALLEDDATTWEGESVGAVARRLAARGRGGSGSETSNPGEARDEKPRHE